MNWQGQNSPCMWLYIYDIMTMAWAWHQSSVCHNWLILVSLAQTLFDTKMQTIFRMWGTLKSTLINYPSFNKGWILNLRLADYYYQNCWDWRHVLFNYSEAKPENTEKSQLMLVDKMIVPTRSQWESERLDIWDSPHLCISWIIPIFGICVFPIPI